jgi:acetyltransferase-like isoleucine patch superfamily enzyme
MMNVRRLRQVCKYGWKDALLISKTEGEKKSRGAIFSDILYCYFKYNVWSNQYKKEKLYALDKEQRKEICLKYMEKNSFRDKWVKEFFDNYKFLNKWSSFKYERSASLQAKRHAAYKKQYGLGDNCFVGHNVIFHKHHFSTETIHTGVNCHISEHSDIDLNGGLILGNGIAILEGVKILTHGHDYLQIKNKGIIPNSKRAYHSPLQIGDNATIGSHSIIMPGVHYIGKNSIISAGSVVTKRIPDNVIVAGNPAKVIGSIEGLNIYQRNNNNE